MEIKIRHSPSFAVARCKLAGGESIKTESGAMVATSGGVTTEAKMQGGLMQGLKRSVLGGESLFVSTFTAPKEGGWVDVAANLPGDVVVLPVPPSGLNLTRGSWLASEPTVELDTKWGGFRSAFGGEGGFMIHATGTGSVVAACYGALDTMVIPDGDSIVVDSGHLVAFDPNMTFTTRKVSTGLIQTLKSGEGLVMEFTGPGVIHTQTRNPSALISWLTSVLPFSRG